MFTLQAQAKINWFLHITGKRPDGYHNIISLMQLATLHDTLAFKESDRLEIHTQSPIPTEENLVYKAARLVMARAATGLGAEITLKKDTPLSAGLGGGSSDAAAAIVGLDRLWHLGLNKEAMHTIAAEVGSDVPFFLNGPVAIARGRGTELSLVSIDRSYFLALLNPGIAVSTKLAYSEARPSEAVRMRAKGPDISELFTSALNSGDFSKVRPLAANDLEGVVTKKHPIIKELKDRLYAEGALFSAMSGSGSTVFGVFEGRDKAEEATGAILPAISGGNGKGLWARVVETVV